MITPSINSFITVDNVNITLEYETYLNEVILLMFRANIKSSNVFHWKEMLISESLATAAVDSNIVDVSDDTPNQSKNTKND